MPSHFFLPPTESNSFFFFPFFSSLLPFFSTLLPSFHARKYIPFESREKKATLGLVSFDCSIIREMHFRAGVGVGVGVVGKHCAARSFGFLAGIARARFHGKFLPAPGVCRRSLSAPPSSGRGGMRGKNGDSSAENEKSHPLGRGDIDAGCKNILFHALLPAFFPPPSFLPLNASLFPRNRFISHLSSFFPSFFRRSRISYFFLLFFFFF